MKTPLPVAQPGEEEDVAREEANIFDQMEKSDVEEGGINLLRYADDLDAQE